MSFISKLFNKEPINVEQDWKTSFGRDVSSIEYPDCSLHELVYETVLKYPNYKALKYFGKEVTFKEFYTEIEDIAKSLKAIGVKKGDRITICMPNMPEAISFFYAVNMVGAIANMIHPLSSVNEMEFYLDVAKSKYVLTLDLLLQRMTQASLKLDMEKIILAQISNSMPIHIKVAYEAQNLLKNVIKGKPNNRIIYDKNKIINWDEFIELGEGYKKEYKVPGKGKDEAVVIYSGGTTGKPKGVQLSNLAINAEALQAISQFESAKPGAIALSILPIFHGFGLAVNIHTIIVVGATCVLIPKFEPEEMSKLIKRNKPHFLIGVPTMFDALTNSNEISRTYLKTVTDVVCGGDTLKPELRAKVNKYLAQHGSKAQIRVGYGLSESTAAVILTPSFYYQEDAIGLPFPNVEVKITKPGTTKECKVNRNGEICVTGPTLMMGYLNEPEETAETLITHPDGKIWLHTGDLGYKNKEGIVFFQSRLKRMIITSGYNVYPQYLETIIGSHPAVFTSMVVGIDHPYKKQVPVANIILNDSYEPSEELKADLKRYCAKSIAKYAMPVGFEFHKSFPKTLIGKVNFKKLEEDNFKKYGKGEQ